LRESSTVKVLLKRLPEGSDIPVPEKATAHSAGFDLRACVGETLVLPPGSRSLIPTGIAVALPEGHEAQIRPRSGLAVRHGLTLLNTPGTVDADYRGEIKVVLANLGEEPVEIRRGDRIAQMVIQRLPTAILEEVRDLPETGRGAGGFGHTGTE
jgi:dUTP pyrophosphatase